MMVDQDRNKEDAFSPVANALSRWQMKNVK